MLTLTIPRYEAACVQGCDLSDSHPSSKKLLQIPQRSRLLDPGGLSKVTAEVEIHPGELGERDLAGLVTLTHSHFHLL